MRKQNCAPPGIRLQALENMLEEGVVRAPLRRCAQKVATILVMLKCAAIPLLDGVRRIRQHQIELLQLPVLNEGRVL